MNRLVCLCLPAEDTHDHDSIFQAGRQGWMGFGRVERCQLVKGVKKYLASPRLVQAHTACYMLRDSKHSKVDIPIQTLGRE